MKLLNTEEIENRNTEKLKDAVKKLPTQPGIYLMKNSGDSIIYVGKAKNLKARVTQYFQKSKNHSPKIVEMVQQIDSFEYVIVDTELEAFLLESQKIKELQPRYNKLLKNYQNYKYIKLAVNKEFPIPQLVTEIKSDGALYFGPFSSPSSTENAIEFIQDAFNIRKCKNRILKKTPSGCLNMQLGKCFGPCTGVDVFELYNAEIRRVVSILEGKEYEPVKKLRSKMLIAAQKLEFERAAQYREQLKGIRHVLYKQKIIKISSFGRNIIAAEKYGQNGAKLFFIKGNRLLAKEDITLSGCTSDLLGEELRSCAQAYFKAKKNTDYNLNQEEIDEAHIIYSYIKNKKNGVLSINVPLSRVDNLNYCRFATEIMK